MGNGPLASAIDAHRRRVRGLGSAADRLIQTLARLQQRHPGFESSRVAAARVVLWVPGTRKESATALYNIHRRVLDALEALPGVRSAAVTNYLPYSGTSIERIQADIFIKGRAEEETKTLASITGADVSPDYFATSGFCW
jgi:hypothetical protein